jgi:peptide-methionine (S)-S-oxide reductase
VNVNNFETATIAGGCFWCIEAVFSSIDGVESAISGYTGGTMEKPTYDAVCTGKTGHAEAVQVTYDPETISFRTILEIFFSIHDPTTLNRQGADIGTQYRSAVFYQDAAQKQSAEEVVRELDKKHLWKGSIVTEIVPLTKFYPAEEYHQHYFTKHPGEGYCRIIISPKINKLRKEWANRLKAE